MNILITVSVRWWNANAYYAISLAKALSTIGHQVYVAGDPAYPPTSKAQEAGLETIEIRFASFNPIVLIYGWYKLFQFVKKKDINIINPHRSEDHFLTALIAQKFKIPLIRSLGDVRSPKDNFINRWLHLKITDYHILSSESSLIRYKSTWPEFKNSYSIIMGGIDGNIFDCSKGKSDVSTKLNLPNDTFIVGIVARLSPIKDHVTFIMAASLVLEEISNVLFIISGSEEEVFRKDLKSLAKSLNISDQLLFLDRYEPVNELMCQFDVGVVASKGSEVISRVAMEYIATGTPVVATNINVLPELVKNNHNGFIVPVEDPYSMANAIIRLLQDNELRDTISKNNIYDFKTKFDIIGVAKLTASIYQNLIEKYNILRG